jgi:hypothetical protein
MKTAGLIPLGMSPFFDPFDIYLLIFNGQACIMSPVGIILLLKEEQGPCTW